MKFELLYKIEKTQPLGNGGRRAIFVEALEQVKVAEQNYALIRDVCGPANERN